MVMREIVLHWDLFRGAADKRQLSEQVMARLLTLQTLLNVEYLRSHPDTPQLYESGLRYAVEGPFNEEWKTIPVCLGGDVLDCEDAACWRAAELIVSGEDPDARPVFRGRRVSKRRRLYHVIVMRGDGSLEDPSKVLGMGTRQGKRRPLG